MCGISGFIDYDKKSTKETLIRMTDVLHHRGPDDSGYSFYNNEIAYVGLGHRRLSILDLTTHGHQPMAYENIEIVYNGEIYNFIEIKSELEEYGYSFESHSDTEVILKAYHKWGIKAVDRFNGMFAIAIYDKSLHKLTLLRDRAGVKPLYWYYKDAILLFASELKSFHEHPLFLKEIDMNSLALFLQYGYILQPYSIFKYTRKLKSGHYLEIDLKSKQIEECKYWDVIDYYNKPKINISEAEALEETEKLLKSAFEYRMVSDVPVGVFLSGGYDSSIVTALLQSQKTEKIKTFTIGFHENKYNEAPHAKKVADYLGTEHTEYYCTQKEALDILPLIPEIWDEPFGDSSAIPTTLVSRLAREKVTVSLSADGGDEIFGGYDKYTNILEWSKKVKNTKYIPKKFIADIMANINPHDIPFLSKIKSFDTKYHKMSTFLSDLDATATLKEMTKFFTSKEVNKLLISPGIELPTSFDDDVSNFSNDLDKILGIDYKTYMTDDILTKVDRATMSVGLEGREPLLDYRLIEFVAQLPSNYKIKNGDKKWLLKQITHKYLPKEIMDRPKMGFSVPIFEWFREELKEYLFYYFDENRLESQGIFDVKQVIALRDAYLSGKNINIQKIWFILVFQMWFDKWMKK